MLRELPHRCWNLKKGDWSLLAATQHLCWGVQEGALNVCLSGRLMGIDHNLLIVGWESIRRLEPLRGRCGNVRGRMMRRGSKPDRIWCEFARWVSIMLLFRGGGGGASWVLGRYRKDSPPGCCEGVLLFRGGKWSLCTSSVWLASSMGSALARESRSSGPERALWKGVVSVYAAYGQLPSLAQTRKEMQVGEEQTKGKTVCNPLSILIWKQEKNSLLMHFSAENPQQQTPQHLLDTDSHELIRSPYSSFHRSLPLPPACVPDLPVPRLSASHPITIRWGVLLPTTKPVLAADGKNWMASPHYCRLTLDIYRKRLIPHTRWIWPDGAVDGIFLRRNVLSLQRKLSESMCKCWED